tara:strand:- start:2700 stop:3305 length:606 start_codon:yes stop_codon:yes gene_type:complete
MEKEYEKILTNLLLLVSFGISHSFLASHFFKNLYRKLMPHQTERAFYVILSGIHVTFVMGCWQSTGIVLWVPAFDPKILFWFTPLFSILCAGAALLVLKKAPLSLGFSEIYQQDKDLKVGPLVTSGIFSYTRHPLYLILFFFLWISPWWSLDRLIISLTLSFYLWIGIYFEEKKLIRSFGPTYLSYKKQTPCLFPKLKLNS